MSFLGSGATESIASFEALEEIMNLRQMRFGQDDLVAHAKQKRFKFGNGETKMAESFIELPQTLAGQSVRLGVHTLDAPGVPLLISVKTLTRLRAIVDFEDATICFKQMPTERWLPLKRARNGHLLLDLFQDWLGDVKSCQVHPFGQRSCYCMLLRAMTFQTCPMSSIRPLTNQSVEINIHSCHRNVMGFGK